MGSWNVYCEVTKISIHPSDEVVLMPLKKVDAWNGGTFVPAMIPIHGEYADYGDIECIEEDDNTKLIEKAFGMSIHDFCSELINESLEGLSYCWILAEAYFKMSSHYEDDYFVNEKIDFGKREVLLSMGFQPISKEDAPNHPSCGHDAKRYKHKYILDGKYAFSDHTWVHGADGQGVYSVEDVQEQFPTAKVGHLIGKSKFQILNEIYGFEKLKGRDLAGMFSWLGEETWRNLLEWKPTKNFPIDFDNELHMKGFEGDEELIAFAKKMKEAFEEDEKTMLQLYLANRSNVDLMNQVIGLQIFNNLRRASNIGLYPYHRVGSQFGEHRQHQFVLDLAAKMNRARLRDEEE